MSIPIDIELGREDTVNILIKQFNATYFQLVKELESKLTGPEISLVMAEAICTKSFVETQLVVGILRGNELADSFLPMLSEAGKTLSVVTHQIEELRATLELAALRQEQAANSSPRGSDE